MAGVYESQVLLFARQEDAMLTQFFVPAGSQTPSGKPHFVDERLRQRAPPPDKNIAENRARLLSERQDRLRAQWQHVEQVMQEVKARREAQTATVKATCDNKLASAARARDMRLKSEAQRCYAEVERAKQVSKMNKEKHALQSMQLRDRQFRRISASIERRTSLQSKGESSDSAQGRKKAAFVIQSWWRLQRLKPVVAEFRAIELTLEHVQGQSFDALAAKLSAKKTLECTKAILDAALTPAPRPGQNRVFLSAYMMVAAPRSVFGEVREMEEILLEAARTMLTEFHAWVDCYHTAAGRTARSRLNAAWRHFAESFTQWKRHDSEKLQDVFIAHYVELEALRQTVSGNPTVEKEWFPHIDGQQQQIRQSLVRLGGEAALVRLQKALRLPSGSTRQRTPKPSSSGPTQQPATSDEAAGGISETTTGSATQQEREEPVTLIRRPVSWDLSNEKLAHEIGLNPNFAITLPPPTPAELEARAQFWSAVHSELTTQSTGAKGDNRAQQTVAMLLVAELREALRDCCMDAVSLRSRVDSVLDNDLCAQKCAAGLLNIRDCAGFALEIMGTCCSAARDDDIACLKTMSDLEQLLMGIFDVLGQMRLDVANYRLSQLMPFLGAAEGVVYEREKAMERLGIADVDDDGLSAKLANTAQQLSAARELIGGTRAATLREIVYMMVSDAVCEPASECAETLKCDAERLSEHRRKLSACIHAAAALMVTANGVPALRDDKDFSRELCHGVVAVLSDPENTAADAEGAECGEAVATLAVDISQKFLARRMRTGLEPHRVALLRSVIAKSCLPTDPLNKLMWERVRGVVYELASKPSGVAPETWQRTALTGVQSEVSGIAAAVSSVAARNLRVYEPLYARMLQTNSAAQ